MKVVKYSFEGSVGNPMTGEIEFDDDASDEEIEAEVRDLFFNYFNYGWHIA